MAELNIETLRQSYHRNVCEQVLGVTGETTKHISQHLKRAFIRRGLDASEYSAVEGGISEKDASSILFTQLTQDFLLDAFRIFQSIHLQPLSLFHDLSSVPEYGHLICLKPLSVHGVRQFSQGKYEDWLLPDIAIYSETVGENLTDEIRTLPSTSIDRVHLSPPPSLLHSHKVLYATISCKWMLGSDRSPNSHFEVISLTRKHNDSPQRFFVVTAEPWPTRIAALALGTGDLDCVYHFALHELVESSKELQNQDSIELLDIMIDGRRLRDISDLPFDLAL